MFLLSFATKDWMVYLCKYHFITLIKIGRKVQRGLFRRNNVSVFGLPKIAMPASTKIKSAIMSVVLLPYLCKYHFITLIKIGRKV
jgi:REP element-mobilizing transposase RayT